MNYEVNLDNLTKEEREQFNALVEKANKQNNKAWKPIKGDTYYVIDECADICNQIYVGCVEDKKTYSIGNFFKTREEAEFALERLKVITEMKRYIAEHDEIEFDWNDCEQLKYRLVYNYYTASIDYFSSSKIQSVEKDLYASKGSILLGMLGEIGEDRIKKYYFGIE